jgi:hypothetical protein
MDTPDGLADRGGADPGLADAGGGDAGELVECRISNRESWALGGGNCRAGTVLEMGSAQFRCAEPLSTYGVLPIKVV